MTRKISTFLFLLFTILQNGNVTAQTQVYSPTVKSIKLFRSGDQTSFPVIQLNSSDLLQLEFDDLDVRVKNYYYSFQLCNADWTPSMLTSFDYIRGFQSQRIATYRNSSLATVSYVHYQATVPDRNSAPSRAGNYL
ncbi:MAG: DUF5103 domain-containing protein, partial [Bacteroidota bacterium]|nr:DUF5103 domain-containing protein [Bacteroidota bacterium]